MRADRDKRAAVLNAEGVKQSQILTAEGERQSNVLRAQGDKEAFALRAEGERQAAILRSQGEAQAIETVFASIHAGNPDPKLLSYQYLQTLPRIAKETPTRCGSSRVRSLGRWTACRASLLGPGERTPAHPRRLGRTDRWDRVG